MGLHRSADCVVSQVTRYRHPLSVRANAAFPALQVAVAFRTTEADRVRVSLYACTACFAHGVVSLIAGVSFVLVITAFSAVLADIVCAAFGTA